MNIIHENCEKKVSEDKKLPKRSYLVTYVAKDTGDGDYKLSGSNKSAKWLQFKLEEIDKPLDSIGIIFRTKSIR